MPGVPPLFEPRNPSDIHSLIAEYPLAWLVSGQFNASPLPLIGEADDEGEIVSLFGHCALGNPLVADFRAEPRGLILFNGPAGYVSPALVSRRDWAPTWNFAVLRFTVTVEFVGAETRDSIEQLVTMMEGETWSTDRLGPRYEPMLARIIAFRARVTAVRHQFKLGQDESPQSFAEIVAGHPDRTLVHWMEGQATR